VNILMLVWTDVESDARVRREAETLASAGHHVHVIGRGVPPTYKPGAGITVSSAGQAPSGSASRGTQGAAARVARWLLLPTYVRRRLRRWTAQAAVDARGRQFDAVHAHDFTALPLAAELARERGVPLVYDTHEFWPGRPRLSRPTPWRRWRERRLEAHLGGQAVAVITVGPGLAELLRDTYGWTTVQVVRNSFPMNVVEDRRPPGQPTGAVYAGRIAPHRELETVIAAADLLEPLDVTVVGPADPAYAARLRTGRVQIRPSAPLDDVVDLMQSAGLALVTHSNRWINHRLALPNKLFLAVQAGVPVVATDVPELRRVVTEHGLGELYRPGDPQALAAAVRRVIDDYDRYTSQVLAARPALSWERDAPTLLGLYAGTVSSDASVE
jgi:glycosyltransferase involved in cell wall biosynthesis